MIIDLTPLLSWAVALSVNAVNKARQPFNRTKEGKPIKDAGQGSKIGMANMMVFQSTKE